VSVDTNSFSCGAGFFRAAGVAATNRTTLAALMNTAGTLIFFVKGVTGTILGTDMTTTNGEIAAQGFYGV
jgi:hypothetical protein